MVISLDKRAEQNRKNGGIAKIYDKSYFFKKGIIKMGSHAVCCL